jgi:CheY-like chemotaxis protein
MLKDPRAKIPSIRLFQAFDGFEAGVLLSEQKPVSLFSTSIFRVDGFKLCSRIKNDPEIGKPIVVAVSGLDEQTTQKQILAEGADAFFPKPIDFEQLLSTLQSMVR